MELSFQNPTGFGLYLSANGLLDVFSDRNAVTISVEIDLHRELEKSRQRKGRMLTF